MMIESNNKQTHILYGELKFKYILKIVIKRNFLCQKKKEEKEESPWLFGYLDELLLWEWCRGRVSLNYLDCEYDTVGC